jgi:hypothetical protein
VTETENVGQKPTRSLRFENQGEAFLNVWLFGADLAIGQGEELVVMPVSFWPTFVEQVQKQVVDEPKIITLDKSEIIKP